MPNNEKQNNTTSTVKNTSHSVECRNKQKTFQVNKMQTDKMSRENKIFLSKTYENNNSLVKITHRTIKNMSLIYPVAFTECDDKDIFISSIVRAQLGYDTGDDLNIEFVELSNEPIAIETLSIELCKVTPSSKQLALNHETLAKDVKSYFNNYPLSPSQELFMRHDDTWMLWRINYINNDTCDTPTTYRIHDESQIEFIINTAVKNCTISKPATPLKLTFDFNVKGVGGHKDELGRLIRDAFYTRAMGEEYTKAYDIKHTKGVLLYGPPGTGKTLIARTIGEFFSKDKIKVVNGPELKSKFVGESEKSLRGVFHEAQCEWNENGSGSDLHVIIIDEIDALCPARGTRTGGTGVDDDMVTQLLTILDGPKELHNIVVIGMTNRKELIDPAILRPGRLGVHIEIGLPNKEARLEILSIKTKTMGMNNLLDEDVDLSYWADKTANFTGAELEELVKSATHFAMKNNFDQSPDAKELVVRKEINNICHLSKVTQEHFQLAFSQITPAFGHDKKIRSFSQDKFACYTQIERIKEVFHISCTAMHQTGDRPQFLLSGESGTGKTATAMFLAQSSGSGYIKVISAENLLSLSQDKQLQLIDTIFSEAERAESSVIVLDALENIVFADAQFISYNNHIRIKLQEKLKETKTKNKCTIIATTANIEFIERIGLSFSFQEREQLNPLSLRHLSTNATLKKICAAIEYNTEDSNNVTCDDQQNTQITIRELIYQIKKFCSQSKTTTLDIGRFYDSLKCNQNSKAQLENSNNQPSLFSKGQSKATQLAKSNSLTK